MENPRRSFPHFRGEVRKKSIIDPCACFASSAVPIFRVCTFCGALPKEEEEEVKLVLFAEPPTLDTGKHKKGQRAKLIQQTKPIHKAEID